MERNLFLRSNQMTTEMKTRKAEIVSLLKIIEEENQKYSEAKEKSKKDNLSKVKGFLPCTGSLILDRFENSNFYNPTLPTFRFSFSTKNRESLSIDIQEKSVVYYSITGCSDRNPKPEEFESVTAFYSNAAILMKFFNYENIKLFNLLSKSFSEVNWEEYHTSGLNENTLKMEMRDIERQEKVDAIDLKVGSVISFYVESKGRYQRSAWVIAKVTKLTEKKFQFAQWHDHEKRWMDSEYEIQNGVINYDRIQPLNEKQIQSMEKASI
jgi:hypothetical protein